MEERVGNAPTAVHPCVFPLRSVVPYKAFAAYALFIKQVWVTALCCCSALVYPPNTATFLLCFFSHPVGR